MLQSTKKSNRPLGRGSSGRFPILLLSAFAILICPLSVWSGKLSVTDSAPDFALKSLSGKNLRLSEYRGEVVLLNFWAVHCGRCREQLSVVDDLYEELEGEGITILSISIGHDLDETEEMVSALGLGYPVMTDDRNTASKLYDLGKLPLTVLIDPHGTVRYVHTGFRRGDERMYREQLNGLLAE
jgi:peroxiredoxin